MKTPAVHTVSPATSEIVDRAPAVEIVVARAVAACVIAHERTVALRRDAATYLRAVREAGRHLLLVQRSGGGRPEKNSVRRVTSFQDVLERARISRPTASRWQKVAGVPDTTFEDFLRIARETGRTPSVEDLLDFACPANKDGSDADPGMRTVRLRMSARDYHLFKHRIDQLGASFQADTFTAAVLELAERGHADFLRAQLRPRRRFGATTRAA
jgi:hypothetical protein